MKIIYPHTDGTICILIPVEGCGLTVEQIAQKDTPYGVPYFIVEDNALPEDWSSSHCWECDFSQPHGTGMSAQRFFIAQAQAELAAIAARPQPTPQMHLPQPEDMADDAYAAYIAEVDASNKRVAEAFAAQQLADTQRCEALINQMKAEVLAIEGVSL